MNDDDHRRWAHVDHDLSQLMRLHVAMNEAVYADYPEVVRRAMNVAYAAHFRTLMEFVHARRPKSAARHADISSAGLLGTPLTEAWSAEEERRLADADKLVGHLSEGRLEREGMVRDWGCPEDRALWEPYCRELIERATVNLPRSAGAAEELRKASSGS